jgi:hypothetical protein
MRTRFGSPSPSWNRTFLCVSLGKLYHGLGLYERTKIQLDRSGHSSPSVSGARSVPRSRMLPCNSMCNIFTRYLHLPREVSLSTSSKDFSPIFLLLSFQRFSYSLFSLISLLFDLVNHRLVYRQLDVKPLPQFNHEPAIMVDR